MNSLNTFDPVLFLQNQLILQQMLVYNQILKASFNNRMPTPKIFIPKLEEIETSNSQSFKHYDTHQIQTQDEQYTKTKTKKIQKKQEMRKSKIYEKNQQSEELPKKKKVFLSMLDIKEAKYKKFKLQNNEDNFVVSTHI